MFSFGSFFQIFGAVVAVLCFSLIFPKSVNAKAGEHFRQTTQFVDGLLQRGLFLSANFYCEEQVQCFSDHAAKDDKNDKNYASSLNFYVSEKINVLTRLALTQPEPQRRETLRQLELWEQQWSEKFAKGPENAVRSAPNTEFANAVSYANVFRFPLQLAISDQMLGELFRYEEIWGLGIGNRELSFNSNSTSNSNLKLQVSDPHSPSPIPHPQSPIFLNRALAQLQSLQKNVEQITGTGRITRKQAEELLAVEHQIEFRTALTWRTFAMGGESEIAVLESSEKIDALQRAVRGFSNLALLSGKDPIIWQSRLERITCLRLLLELDEASRAWDKLMESKSEFSKDFLIQATTEAVRLDLAKGNVEQAVRRSGVARKMSSNAPDFELARLETALSKWRLTRIAEKQQSATQPPENSKNSSQPWLEKSLELVDAIQENFGPYWGRRAQMLLARSAKNQATDNFQVYVQLAEDAYRRNRFTEAVEYYDLAQRGAESQKDDESAFQFALAAASVESAIAANERNIAANVATNRQKYGTNENLYGNQASVAKSHEESAAERFFEAAKKWTTRKESEEIYLHGISLSGRLLSQGKMSNSEMIDRLLEFMQLWPNSTKKPEIARRTAALLEREERFEEALQICPEFEGRAKTTLEIRKLVQENRIDDALMLAKEVLDKNQQSGSKAVDLQMQYGELLALSDRPERLRSALEFWRNLEKQLEAEDEQKTSEPLWKAKEMIVRIHEKLGNRQQAKKMLDLHFLLHANRWSADQKKRFEELRNRLSR